MGDEGSEWIEGQRAVQSQCARCAMQEQMKPPVAQAGVVPAPRAGADSTDLGRQGLVVQQVTMLSSSGSASRMERATQTQLA